LVLVDDNIASVQSGDTTFIATRTLRSRIALDEALLAEPLAKQRRPFRSPTGGSDCGTESA